MSTEFDHITVPSQDLQKSIAFYTSLGMELIELEKEHHAHFENKEHHVIFTAYYNQKRPDYEVRVYFEVSKLEMFEKRFRESIPSQTSSPIQQTTSARDWGGLEMHLVDPDGNFVVLYEKINPTNMPPWQQLTHES